jgi:hypothetical protein
MDNGYVHDIIGHIRNDKDSMMRKYWLTSETILMWLLLKMSIIKSIIMITITWLMILNDRWGFRQISQGPDASAFCHDLFQRDVPRHCQNNNQQQERSWGCENVSQNYNLQQERSQVCENSSQNNVPVSLLVMSSLKLQMLLLVTSLTSYSMWLLIRTSVT